MASQGTQSADCRGNATSSPSSSSSATEKSPIDLLTTAAARGDVSEVTRLVRIGVSVNQPNTYGCTPLQVTRASSTDVAEVLLNAGADPNVRDRGVDPEGGQPTLATPLHDMAREGYMDTVRCLLRCGADLTLRDAWGNTPVHAAAKHGHYDIVRYLAQGMDVARCVNCHGLTALDYIKARSLQRNKKLQLWVKGVKENPPSMRQLCVARIRDALGSKRLMQHQSLTAPVDIQAQLMLQCTKRPADTGKIRTKTRKRKH